MEVEQTTKQVVPNTIQLESLAGKTHEDVLIILINKINAQQKEINGLWNRIRKKK